MAKIRQEINISDVVIFNSSGVQPPIVQLDTTQYSGTVSYYFEILALKGQTSNGTVTLRRSGTTTDDATITVDAAGTDSVRYRTSFTPPNGQTQYVVNITSLGGIGGSVRAARIVVLQDTGTDPLTSTETQIEIGNNETGKTNTSDSALTNPKYWYYDSTVWDGTLTCYAEVSCAVSDSMYGLLIKLQEDNGSFASWTDKVTISSTTSISPGRYRVTFTPTSGRNYRLVGVVANSMGSWNIYNAKIILQQSASAITKLEPQYLLSNTAVGATTGLQNYDTLFDPAEWSGVTNTYYHEANNVASGTSDAKLQSDPNGTPADITGSTITDIIERERSSALTMPGAAATIDVNQTGT